MWNVAYNPPMKCFVFFKRERGYKNNCYWRWRRLWFANYTVNTYLTVVTVMLLYLSLWVFLCGIFLHALSSFLLLFLFFRADALAGVRKQGCKSLSQAYCMVSTGGLEACFLSIYITPKMLSKYMFHLFSIWSMMLSYIYCSSDCSALVISCYSRSNHGITASSCSGASMTLCIILKSPRRQTPWQQEKWDKIGHLLYGRNSIICMKGLIWKCCRHLFC